MKQIAESAIDWEALEAYVQAGGIIAYPTEGIYGFGGLATHPDLPDAITRLKGKSMRTGIITLIDRFERIEHWVDSEPNRIPTPWPPFTTYVFKASDQAPKAICDHGTIAIRVPHHALCQRLCAKLGPLLSTSANPTGKLPPKDAKGVLASFKDADCWLIDGSVGSANKPSTIIDAQSGKILRA